MDTGVQYPEKLHGFHKDLPFLPERMKVEESGKIAANVLDEKEYVTYTKPLNQAFSHEFVFKKVKRAIKFNQKA